MCFTVCGAKEERIQCRTEDPETRGGEDHGYLQRGSGGGEVGGWGGQFTPTGLAGLAGRKSTSFIKDNRHLFTWKCRSFKDYRLLLVL